MTWTYPAGAFNQNPHKVTVRNSETSTLCVDYNVVAVGIVLTTLIFWMRYVKPLCDCWQIGISRPLLHFCWVWDSDFGIWNDTETDRSHFEDGVANLCGGGYSSHTCVGFNPGMLSHCVCCTTDHHCHEPRKAAAAPNLYCYSMILHLFKYLSCRVCWKSSNWAQVFWSPYLQVENSALYRLS